MKKSKKLLSLLLTICMLLSAVPIVALPASAANTISGTDISWTVSSGTLTITGTGEIPSFTVSNNRTNAPWKNNGVSTIFIGEGITGIGMNAFYGMGYTGLTVQLPSTIKNIGNKAFSYSNISTLILSPKTDKSLVIKSDAFETANSFRYIKFSDSSTTGDFLKIVDNVLYTADSKEIICIPTGVSAFTPSSDVEKIPNADKISFDGFFNSTAIDSDLTVDVVSFKDGTSSSMYYLGELLEAKVSSKSGKSTDDLYYGWVMLSEDNGSIQNTGYYNFISGFDNSDLSDSDGIQFSKTAKWAATKGRNIITSNTLFYFALVVCRKDSSGKYNIVGKRQFIVAPNVSGYGASDSLAHCVKSNTVTMFKGETISLQQLLGRCGITHTTCSHTTINNAYTAGTEYLTVSGTDITANNLGQNITVVFDYYCSLCLYHAYKTVSSTGNELTINVIDPVTTTSDCADGFTITNPVSGYDYTIGNNKGTLSDGKIIFDNLNGNTDYTLKLSLTGKYGAAAAQVTEKITTGSFEHTYSSKWTYDSTQHWHVATCVHSTLKTDVATHTGMDDGICDVCGYKMPEASKNVETSNNITISEETDIAIQNYINSQKSSLTYDTSYKFTVKEQEPSDNTKKNAIEDKAGTNRTVTFFDATFTKTEIINNVAQTPVEISETGETVLSFTIPYDMDGRCDLAVYRYHDEAETLARVYTTSNPQDKTYYVEGTGKDTKITVFANKFSPVGIGSSEIPEAVENATYAASLTLKDNIDVNFKIKNIPSAEEAKLKVYLNNSDTPTDFTLKNGETSAMSVSVSPENMSDYIHVKVVYDDIKVREFDYCIKDYCDAIAVAYTNDNATYGKLNDLCKAVLIYGKYAEDKKNDNTDSDLYDVSGLTLNAPAKNNSNFVNSTNIEKAGASLTLGSTISMNFYVKVKDSGIDLTETDENGQYKNFKILNNKAKKEKVVTNLTVTPLTDNADGYNYKITISNIYAEQMSREYTLTVNGDKTFTATYGIYDYCLEAQDGTAENGFTDTVKNLCKAIYNYGEKAAAFTA